MEMIFGPIRLVSIGNHPPIFSFIYHRTVLLLCYPGQVLYTHAPTLRDTPLFVTSSASFSRVSITRLYCSQVAVLYCSRRSKKPKLTTVTEMEKKRTMPSAIVRIAVATDHGLFKWIVIFHIISNFVIICAFQGWRSQLVKKTL